MRRSEELIETTTATAASFLHQLYVFERSFKAAAESESDTAGGTAESSESAAAAAVSTPLASLTYYPCPGKPAGQTAGALGS